MSSFSEVEDKVMQEVDAKKGEEREVKGEEEGAVKEEVHGEGSGGHDGAYKRKIWKKAVERKCERYGECNLPGPSGPSGGGANKKMTLVAQEVFARGKSVRQSQFSLGR